MTTIMTITMAITTTLPMITITIIPMIMGNTTTIHPKAP
jgi:Ca2+/Na+ antiporter